YGEGISREGDLIDLAVAQNVVEKSGAWFSYQGERLGQGRENVRTLLRQDTAMRDRIESEVKQKLGFVKAEAAPA
ncbi:MAG TPA: recombinase RecA, partial [Pyrinomonadaceae bacterium]|nr:recombinase RecA [Pyrinomonadaceae bacterium]